MFDFILIYIISTLILAEISVIYHEESNPDCNIINWQAKDY